MQYRNIRSLSIILLLILGLLAIGFQCPTPNGGEGEGEEMEMDGTVQAAITPMGGSVTVRTDEGTDVSITFPEGAIGEVIDVTLTPLEPDDTSWFRVLIEPAGIALNRPIEIEVTAPAGAPLDSSSTLFFGQSASPLFIPTAVDLSARKLTASLHILGYPDDLAGKTGLAQQGNGGGATLAAQNPTCQAYLDAANGALELLVGLVQFDRALALFNSYQSFAQDALCAVDLEEWEQTLAEVSCMAYTNAVDNAELTATENLGDFRMFSGPVVYWASPAMLSGSDCANQFFNVLETEINEFLTFYEPELDTLSFGAFQDLKEEAKSLITLKFELQSLGLAEAADTLQEEMINPVMDAMRESAYCSCYEDDDPYFLTRVTQAGFNAPRDILGVTPDELFAPGFDFPFTDDDIYRDLQYCASQIQIESRDAEGSLIETINLGGGDEPGDADTEDGIQIASDGRLNISGKILSLSCFTGSVTSADDVLTLSLDGNVLPTTISPGVNMNFLHELLTLNIPQIFEQAGVEYFEEATYDLQISRNRAACPNELFGPPETTLFTITLGGQLQQPLECSSERVEIRTQEDLDTLVGATQLDADLFIYGPEELTDLSELSSLRRVCTLQVNGLPNLLSLNGLQSLESVDVLQIIICPQLSDISALSSLQSVTGENINLSGLPALTSLAPLSGLSFEASRGELRIEGMPLVASLTPLSGLSGTFSFVSIQQMGVSNLTGLAGIDEIWRFHLMDNESLTDISALSGVQFPKNNDCSPNCGIIAIKNNNLANLNGLQGATSLRSIYIREEPVTDTSALSVSGEIEELLEISDCNELTQLQGFEGVTSVTDLAIYRNESLTAANLGGITEVRGVGITENLSLLSTGLSSLKTARYVDVIGNQSMQTTGLSSLETVTSHLQIHENPSMTTIGLPSLTAACFIGIFNNPNVPEEEVEEVESKHDQSVCDQD